MTINPALYWTFDVSSQGTVNQLIFADTLFRIQPFLAHFAAIYFRDFLIPFMCKIRKSIFATTYIRVIYLFAKVAKLKRSQN